MRKLICLLPLLFALLLLALPYSSFATMRGISVTAAKGQNLYLYKDYYALVVGISNYEKWPDLPSASIDAQEVATKLKEIGFEVKLVLNPSAEELRKALSDIVYEKGSEKNRALLFYFAGHGETLELADGTQLGYIVPADCPLKNIDPMGFDSKAISMKDAEVLALKVKSRKGKIAQYYNRTEIVPEKDWQKIEIPFDDFIPANWTRKNVSNYPPKPDLGKVLQVIFMVSSFEGEGGITGSNTIWIDEIALQ